MFFDTLEFLHHKLLRTNGLILVFPSLQGWEVFPMTGSLIHTWIT